MAMEDTPPPPPPSSSTNKIIPFSIPNKVPIKLDLEKHNYNAWSSFSLIHLCSLGLKAHVESKTASTNPEWEQLDDLIKMWILSSLYLFHDNKDHRALNLDNELHSIKIKKMTVNEYCTKIRSMADRLKNLGGDFTRDNNCTIEFDAFSFSMKDFLTRHILLRCDSSGDLYPVTKPSILPSTFVSTIVSNLVLTFVTTRVSGQRISLAKVNANALNRSIGFDNPVWGLNPCDHPVKRGCYNFDETFSPVVKPVAIRTVLSLVVSRQWPIHQLDVKNDFLNDDLSKTGFAGYATRAGSTHSLCDSSLFIYTQGSRVSYLLIYVDDIILTASSLVLLLHIINSLHKEFDMTNLEALNYFLGISVVHHSTGIFLSQKKYALDLLACANMVNCNPSRTLVDYEAKLGLDGVPVQDLTLYLNLAVGLYCLTFTRPDLSYAVQQICLYMHDPMEPHFVALKRNLHYVQGTLELGLHLYASATTSLVGYTNADWAGCPSTRSAVYMSANPVQHQRTKHIEINIHFVRDMVKAGHVRVLHVPSRFQYVGIFTNCLPSALFENFRSSLSVCSPPAQTTRTSCGSGGCLAIGEHGDRRAGADGMWAHDKVGTEGCVSPLDWSAGDCGV
nr:ribonuclease H-like domain-containing protein [Tanacetum cinerariifolium]